MIDRYLGEHLEEGEKDSRLIFKFFEKVPTAIKLEGGGRKVLHGTAIKRKTFLFGFPKHLEGGGGRMVHTLVRASNKGRRTYLMNPIWEACLVTRSRSMNWATKTSFSKINIDKYSQGFW